MNTVLTDEQKAEFVADITDYGTGFVGPLFAVVDSIEQAVLQSPEVQALRSERKALHDLVKELVEKDTYETEYDGRVYSICHGCGAQDGEPHRDSNCLYIRAQTAINAAMESKT